jgi:DNA-binding HxlR family transcriptional regulator
MSAERKILAHAAEEHAALERLHARGLVRRVSDPDQPHVYHLTERGRRVARILAPEETGGGE